MKFFRVVACLSFWMSWRVAISVGMCCVGMGKSGMRSFSRWPMLFWPEIGLNLGCREWRRCWFSVRRLLMGLVGFMGFDGLGGLLFDYLLELGGGLWVGGEGLLCLLD